MRAGLYLVAVFCSPADVGIYGVALMIAEVFLYLPNAISHVVLGATSARVYRKADRNRVSWTLAILGTGLCAGMLVVGRPLLFRFFGSAYLDGAVPAAILLMAVTIHAIGLVRLHELLGVGRPMAATRAQAVTVVFTVSLGAFLIPRLGILGAAMSTLLSYTAFTSYLLFVSSDPLPAGDPEASAAPARLVSVPPA
jgi:O-antigen/teichoic acid export membrane protein